MLGRPRRLDGTVDIQLDDLELRDSRAHTLDERLQLEIRLRDAPQDGRHRILGRQIGRGGANQEHAQANFPGARSSLAALIVVELQHVLDGAAPDDIGDLSRGQLTPAAEADDDRSRRQLQRFLQRCWLADDDRVCAERPRVQPEVVACRQRAIEQAIDDGFRADNRVGLVMADDDGEAREAQIAVHDGDEEPLTRLGPAFVRSPCGFP